MSSLLLFVATRDLPPRVIRFPHLQRRERPTSARHARSDRRAGLAAGHAPRRAGPAAGGAAALVRRGRGRHAARTAITTPLKDVLGTNPPATPGKAQGLTWCYGTPTATTLGTHGPKRRSGRAADDYCPDHDLGGLLNISGSCHPHFTSSFQAGLGSLCCRVNVAGPQAITTVIAIITSQTN
jgi:hypothetical protein